MKTGSRSAESTRELLFGVDLEDVRDHVRDGHTYPPRVAGNTERYLEFLHSRGIRATFFIVGSVAERNPGLIRDIVAEGHEVACHTHTHVQLDRHTPESLTEDLQENLEVLYRCGAKEVVGFRAPTFSMLEETQWAYPVLEKLGLEYSASVLPARNPLYGWPGFGTEPRMMGGVLEIPITLHPRLPIPVAGGVYFRVLPFFLIRKGIEKLSGNGRPVQSYIHPHDIDTRQERFMHPDLSDSKLLNALMYVGRSKVLSRLEWLTDMYRFTSYRDYLYGGRDESRRGVEIVIDPRAAGESASDRDPRTQLLPAEVERSSSPSCCGSDV